MSRNRIVGGSVGFGLALALMATAGTTASAEVVVIGPQDARAIALERGWPIKGETADGRKYELQEIVDGYPIYYIQHNLNAADTSSTDEVWPSGSAGLNLTGAGVNLGVWDMGAVLASHQEFTGRVMQMDSPYEDDDHATHVAGTMIARGINPDARGMAYAATLSAYDWNSDLTEARTAANGGMLVSNHSYGIPGGWEVDKEPFTGADVWTWNGDIRVSEAEDYRFGYYDYTSASWDGITFDNPRYLPVVSAGNDRSDNPPPGTEHRYFNPYTFQYEQSTATRDRDGGDDGYDCLQDKGVSKNTLTVGAVDDIIGGYSGPSSVIMSDFSCWGPTDDGRIKPDVVANGVEVLSCVNSSDESYAEYWGTSMATPATAGSLGLLIEHFRNTHPGHENMRSATLKGLVIHTADECGTSNGPDYSFGWGLLNTKTAAEVITADVLQPLTISEHTLEKEENEDSAETTLYAATDGSEPLRVTIVWTDPPGDPVNSGDVTFLSELLNNRTKMLVNDLDLRVTSLSDPNNPAVHMPWVLDVDSPTLGATTGDNDTDNVEQIWLAAPGAGAYEISITHKETLQNDTQDFSLIVTGAIAIGDSLAPLATPQVATVTEGGTLDVAVRLVDPPGGDFVCTVGHIGGDNGIAIESPASGELVFTPDNWSTAQYIRLAAAADSNVCDETTTVRITPPPASGRPSTDITAIAADTDVDLIIAGNTTMSLNEGESASIEVTLSGEPCGTTQAKIVKTSGPANIDLATSAALTFSAANWDVPQTITILAAEDDTDFVDGAASFDIVLDTAAQVTKTLTVFDTDNDELGVVANVDQIQVPEGGEVSINIALSAKPPEPVEIRIEKLSGDADLTLVSGMALDFDVDNYWQGQEVVFAAADDDDRLDGSAVFRASFVGASTDFQDLTVLEVDDDKLQFVIDPLMIDVAEWETSQFGVKLNGAPESDLPVTVAWISGDSDIVLTGPTLLTFTAANWDTLQYVSLTATGDADQIENTAQIQLTASGVPTATIIASEKERVSFARPSSPTTPFPANKAKDMPLDVTLRWVGSPIAVDYSVYLSTSIVPRESDMLGTATTNQFTVTGLQPKTTYSWRVVAKNTRGISASPTWTFTTSTTGADADDNTTPPGTDPNDPNDPNTSTSDPNDSNDPNQSNNGSSTPVAPIPCGFPIFTATLAGLAGASVWRRRYR